MGHPNISHLKLESIHFDNGNIVSGYRVSNEGMVQIGDFNVIPEPKLIGIITGIGALGAAYGLRRKKIQKEIQ